MKKFIQENQKAVTTRFPMSSYLELLQEAEERGTTIADVVRTSWDNHKENQQIKELLSQQESRLIKLVFEVCAATSGLDHQERRDALAEFKERLKGKESW